MQLPSIPDSRPWWAPEARNLVVVGYFGLAFYLLYMVGQDKGLLANAAFMTIATLVMGTGGLGIVASFYFGGTKTGSDVMGQQSAALAAPLRTDPVAQIPPNPTPPPADPPLTP